MGGWKRGEMEKGVCLRDVMSDDEGKESVRTL